MFVDDKSNIKVVIHIKHGKEGRGIKAEINMEKIPEEKRTDYKPATFELRQITWKMSNDLMRESRQKNPMTMMDEVDWISYKEKKLLHVLKGWDATDAEGKPIPVTPENVMKLHPLIAELVLQQYDKEAYLEEEERKN